MGHLALTVSCIFFLVAAALQLLQFFQKIRYCKQGLLFFGFFAVLIQGYFLYLLCFPQGVLPNVAALWCLAFASTALLVLILELFYPVEPLVIVVFPCAAITTFLAGFKQAFASTLFSLTPWVPNGIHWILANLTFGLLLLSGLQACCLAIYKMALKRDLDFHWVRALPPLETMEHVFYRLVLLAFITLSALLLISWYTFPLTLKGVPEWLLSGAVWVIFAILLVSRHFFGWRGQLVIRWTLSGVLMIGLIYIYHSRMSFRVLGIV